MFALTDVGSTSTSAAESHSALTALIDTTHPHFWEAWVAVGTPLLALVTLLLFAATWLVHRDSKAERAAHAAEIAVIRVEARKQARSTLKVGPKPTHRVVKR